jgi:hypothetical protein
MYTLLDENYNIFLREHPNFSSTEKDYLKQDYEHRRNEMIPNILNGTYGSSNMWY